MENQEQDSLFMARAISLAERGLGPASPNPIVGCVLVRDGKVIGEGYHKQFGGPHAEVNAVNSVHHPSLLEGSTAYVTLEPCSHFGKTPPCADLLLESKIGRVVIAHEDIHPLVNGTGIERLQSQGMKVEVGLMRDEYAHVNRRFFHAIRHRCPYIILKWAQTADGFIAREDYSSKWISNPAARQLVHQWRSQEDGILVGYNTAIHDDPSLNVRHWKGTHPTRIVIDHDLGLPATLKIFDKTVPTLVVNNRKEQTTDQISWIKAAEDQWEMELMTRLQELAIQSLIIEGGAKTLQHFIDLGMWNEARVFMAPTTFGTGIAAPNIQGNLLEQKDVVGNTLSIYHKD